MAETHADVPQPGERVLGHGHLRVHFHSMEKSERAKLKRRPVALPFKSLIRRSRVEEKWGE